MPRPHDTSSSPVSLSGSSPTMKLGRQVVELRHAPRWQLILGNRPADEAVRALAWLARSVGRQRMAEAFPRLSAQDCRGDLAYAQKTTALPDAESACRSLHEQCRSVGLRFWSVLPAGL